LLAGDRDAVAGAALVKLAAVNELHCTIEEVDIGSAGGLVGAGHLLGFVVEVGKAEAHGEGLLAEAFGAVVGVAFSVVAADGDDVDGAGGVVGSQLRQALFDVLDVGAVGADEEDEQGLVAETGEADSLPETTSGREKPGAVVPSSSMVDSVSAMGCLVWRTERACFQIIEWRLSIGRRHQVRAGAGGVGNSGGGQHLEPILDLMHMEIEAGERLRVTARLAGDNRLLR